MATGMERDNRVCSATVMVARAVKQPRRHSHSCPDSDFTGNNLPLHQTLRVFHHLLFLPHENLESSSNTMLDSTLG